MFKLDENPDGGTQRPTRKQRDYAKAIARTFHVDLPKPMTRDSVSRFIGKYNTAMRANSYEYCGEREDPCCSDDEAAYYGIDPYTGGLEELNDEEAG